MQLIHVKNTKLAWRRPTPAYSFIHKIRAPTERTASLFNSVPVDAEKHVQVIELRLSTRPSTSTNTPIEKAVYPSTAHNLVLASVYIHVVNNLCPLSYLVSCTEGSLRIHVYCRKNQLGQAQHSS